MGKVKGFLGRGGKLVVKEYVSSKLGDWVGFPLGIEDPLDQIICASIYLNSYVLDLHGDKLEVWFYQADNPDLGGHTHATFDARLRFDFLPHKNADVRDKIRAFAGCGNLPPAGPAPGKRIRWEVSEPLTEHGSMLPVESVTDTTGATTADYQVGSQEKVPKPERRQVETLSGMVQATGIGLLPTYDKLEMIVRGLRGDENNPQQRQLPLLLSHYVPQSVYLLRYTAHLQCEQTGTRDEPRGQEEWSYSHDIELRCEIRMARTDNPEVFSGEGQIVYVPGSDMRYRNVGWGIAADVGQRCDHVITWRLTALPPSAATATLRYRGEGSALELSFSPGNLHEREEKSYVTTGGPCPSNTNDWDSHYALSVFREAHQNWDAIPTATIGDWQPGTGDVLAISSMATGDIAASGGRYQCHWEILRPEDG